MKKSILKSLPLVLLVTIPGVATSAEVEVKLKEPNKFIDVLVSGKSRKQSAKVVNKDLVKLFNKLSKDILKEGQKLKIEVTNIDLPGYIDYMRGDGNREIRIIKDTEFYRIEFNYELFDNTGSSVKSGNEKIKGFVSSPPTRMRNSRFGSLDHFAEDIEEWLKSTFSS